MHLEPFDRWCGCGCSRELLKMSCSLELFPALSHLCESSWPLFSFLSKWPPLQVCSFDWFFVQNLNAVPVYADTFYGLLLQICVCCGSALTCMTLWTYKNFRTILLYLCSLMWWPSSLPSVMYHWEHNTAYITYFCCRTDSLSFRCTTCSLSFWKVFIVGFRLNFWGFCWCSLTFLHVWNHCILSLDVFFSYWFLLVLWLFSHVPNLLERPDQISTSLECCLSCSMFVFKICCCLQNLDTDLCYLTYMHWCF